jgi:dTDP-4-dehydrorhamnose reductase
LRILLIGRTGQLGGDLLRANRVHEIDAPSHAEFDICSPNAIASFITPGRYDCVINTAAFHDVPRCEREPETAFAVNCVAVRNLAMACERAGSLLVTFSTDYVFGGEKRRPYLEDDRPGPLQIYGITRLAGEHAALAASPRAVVIRTCGLYGASGARSKGGNFVDRRVEDGRAGAPLEMSSDQVVSPTSTEDLSQAILRLLDRDVVPPGVYHLANSGACSWYEFTCAIFEILRISTPVEPVDRGGRTGEMRRPLYSALGNYRAAALGVTLPPWRDALERYLRFKYQAAS